MNSQEAELADASALLGSKPGSRLSAEQQAEIEQHRQVNMITAAIAGCSWGKGMSSTMRRAYADYCRRYDVDPVTEMDNLGGNVYVNADWYKRKMGELRLLGVIKDYWIEHVHADPRLEALRKDMSIPEEMRVAAQAKWFSMLMKRIQYNLDEDAAAACICTIVLATGGTPIVGAKQAGNGTSVKQPRHGGGSAPNPIAEANAPLFVETSSMRRAAMQVFSHLSGQRLSVKIAIPSVDAMNEEIRAMGERVASVRETMEAASEAAEAAAPKRDPQLLTSGYDESSAFEDAFRAGQVARGEAAIPVQIVHGNGEMNETRRAFVANLQKQPDPYGFVQCPFKSSTAFTDRPRVQCTFENGHDGDHSFITDPCPPEAEHPTPFDDEYEGRTDGAVPFDETGAPPALPPEPGTASEIGGVQAPRELRESPPLKKCMVCEAMVTGPWTPMHEPTCTFYKAPD